MIKFVLGQDLKGKKLVGIGLNDAEFDKLTHLGSITISLFEILHSEIKELTAQDEIFLFHDETDEKMLSELKKRKWDMTKTEFRDYRGQQS